MHAPIIKRSAAFGIDLALSVILLLLLYVIIYIYSSIYETNIKGMLLVSVILSIFWALLSAAYITLRDGFFKGRSLGKKVLGLQVIKIKTGKPCSYIDSILRNILIVIPFCGLIDLMWTYVDHNGRRIGDYIAGTRVMVEKK